MKKYKHLSLEEREKLFAMREQGKKFREIALKFGRSHTTLSREYKRYAKFGKPYLPCKAQKKYEFKLKEQRIKAPLKNPKVFLYVRGKLKNWWTPEQIAGRLSKELPGENICTETIYQYIYGKGKKYKLWEYLPKSHKRRRIKTGRKIKFKKQSRIPGAVSIDKRPKKTEKRKQAGHFETDLMEGIRQTKTALSVTVDRKTRYALLGKVKNKKAKTKQKTILESLKMLKFCAKAQKPIIKSITADNGSENTNHKNIIKCLKTRFYYCHAYASWEKGTVENTIGRIRVFLPKKVDLSTLSVKQVQWLENQLNNTPRKCLNYLTPNEAMEKEVNKYKFRKYIKQKENLGALPLRM